MNRRTQNIVALRESPVHLRIVLSKGRWVAMPKEPMELARTAARLQSHGDRRRAG